MWFLIMLAVVLGVQGELAQPERSYKILMLLPLSSRSHRNVFMPLAETLADRGHKVTILANHPAVFKHPNIVEHMHNIPDFHEDSNNMFNVRDNPSALFNMFSELLPIIARKIYKVPIVKELYTHRKEFDLVIYDHMFNNAIYPFAEGLPSMSIATPGLDHSQSAMYGNVLNPAYQSTLLIHYPFPLTLVDKIKNLFVHIFFPILWFKWSVVPYIQEEISAQFPDIPSLAELERNQSVVLLNSHFSLEMAVPLLPSQVEVGGMHCHPGNPLPQDLTLFMDGAGEAGVIYFSLGTVAKGDTMPVKYREILLEAFTKIPQRIIWKFESELTGVPSNVLINKWLPQQDILADPRVKVFISHAGLLSVQEAMYHGKPILALPIFADQPQNAEKLQHKGLGLSLVWETLTVNQVVESLTELINNPEYMKRTQEVGSIFRDQPQPPLERAVFWTEYVVRHRGAPRLRSPAVQLSWVQFFMLDVLALLLVAVLLCLYLIRVCLRAILRIIGGGHKKKKTD